MIRREAVENAILAELRAAAVGSQGRRPGGGRDPQQSGPAIRKGTAAAAEISPQAGLCGRAPPRPNPPRLALRTPFIRHLWAGPCGGQEAAACRARSRQSSRSSP